MVISDNGATGRSFAPLRGAKTSIYEDMVYTAGFSSSIHVAYMMLFTHPELLKASRSTPAFTWGAEWMRTAPPAELAGTCPAPDQVHRWRR